MRYRVDVLLTKGELVLPLNYRELIQGILYFAMPKAVADEAHIQEKGHRSYQMFTFSRLFGDSDIHLPSKRMFFRRLYFYFSCWDKAVAEVMANNISAGICIFGEKFETRVEPVDEVNQGIAIKMLSPVTVRQTDVETGRITYFEPNTMAFNQAIYNNLKRKYQHFYGEIYDGPFAILADEASLKGTNAKFKQLYIKGYMGKFQLVVSPKALLLLQAVGLGEKNAQGFGMFEVLS